ncbi:MAG: hypothetical protein HY924_06225 [Elusimicrobia bacterium]|nr:hypothetical protein [Elusimicrobiota bacterium]
MIPIKKTIALSLAVIQCSWSFGAADALAQNMVQSARVSGVQQTGVSVIAPLSYSRTSALAGASVLGGSNIQVTGALPSLYAPSVGVEAQGPDAAPETMVPAGLSPEALTFSMAEAGPLPAVPGRLAPATVEAASRQVGEAIKTLDLSQTAPAESSKGSAEGIFAALVGEKLISPSGTVDAASPSPVRSALRRGLGLFKAAPSTAENAEPQVPAPAPAAQPSAKPSIFQHPAARRIAALAGAVAVAALAPLLTANVGLVAAAGSITLSVIGIPQIIHNFRAGKEGVKELAIASPLIWFAAATLLTVVSIGQGSSMWWNAANIAGVLESAAVLGQINWYKRDAKALKATLATVGAVLAPLPLIAMQAFMPLTAWVDLAFTAAMGLLWVLNWPQIKQNYRLFKEEGRAPKGIAPLYPALVVAGSAMHLFAALMGGDLRWAMNGVIAIVTAGTVLGQLYAPRAANAAVGPLVKLSDKISSFAGGLRKAWLERRARSLVAPLFEGRSLSRFEGASSGEQLSRFVAAAKELPGRSLVYLEAPTAAGKSTLARQLEGALPGRMVTFPVDNYFKAKADLPLGLDGKADWDQPESIHLDLAARDIKALLAGERVELPSHDTVAETFSPHSGKFIQLDADDILVVDSIYASHPSLLEAGAGHRSLNVYLTAPAAVRFARRLKRDVVERGIPVERNLRGWSNVLANEGAHILGLQRHADMVVNLVSKEELGRLAGSYAEILAAEWLKNGRDAAMTQRFLDMVRASLEEDFGPAPAPAAVPASEGATSMLWFPAPAALPA